MGSSIGSHLVGVVAAAGEGAAELAEIELPVPPLAFGLVTFAMFMVLLAITYSFKNVSHRR
jgi:hypothetical protein